VTRLREPLEPKRKRHKSAAPAAEEPEVDESPAEDETAEVAEEGTG
jgi:hypothetical protein